MNDFKLTALGLAVVAVQATICAVVIFLAVMFLANRPDGDVRSAALAAPVGRLPGAPPLSPAEESLPPAETTTPTAATPSVVPPAATQAPGTITHTVQSGENLFRISLTYGVTVADIMAANGLVDSRYITAGQMLRIPLDRAVAAPASPTVAPDSEAAADDLPATLTPPVTPSPSATPLPPRPDAVNGLALDAILVMPANVRRSAQQIYARGQELGRDPAAYSKLGDSTIENPFFMARFDEGPYDLAGYAYLQGAVDHFAGSHGRQGVGVRRGFHSWTVTDPTWADKILCLANESSIACEIRLHNPSIMLIRLGSNDAGAPGGFEQNMRQVLDICIDSGVIPVLGTKADRFEGSNVNNETLRRLAAEYQVPLWDFDLVAGTIPGRGLDIDGVHLTTFYAHNYTSPVAYQRGHSMHNLTALMVLDAIWTEVLRESE